jgi:hypothetical protein
MWVGVQLRMSEVDHTSTLEVRYAANAQREPLDCESV